MACYDFTDKALLEAISSIDNSVEVPKERLGLDFILDDAESIEELLGNIQNSLLEIQDGSLTYVKMQQALNALSYYLSDLTTTAKEKQKTIPEFVAYGPKLN